MESLFIDTIKWLVVVVLQARAADLSALEERKRWTSELALGHASLAVNEARALLLLLGGRMNRQARVHLRSLFEFELRLRRILDEGDSVALKLRDAYACEARLMGKSLGVDSSAIDADIADALGVSDASAIRGDKEKNALGGNLRAAMRDEPAPDKRYVGSVAWASQMSHGTVLALREVSKATAGAAGDFFEVAARDPLGDVLLYYGIGATGRAIVALQVRGDDVLPPHAEVPGATLSAVVVVEAPENASTTPAVSAEMKAGLRRRAALATRGALTMSRTTSDDVAGEAAGEKWLPVVPAHAENTDAKSRTAIRDAVSQGGIDASPLSAWSTLLESAGSTVCLDRLKGPNGPSKLPQRKS